MNTLNMDKTENLDKPFFHNIKLHNNGNLQTGSPDTKKLNYYNTITPSSPNCEQYKQRPSSKIKPSCVNSADTSKFKNHFVSKIHNSCYSKETHMVLNNHFDY